MSIQETKAQKGESTATAEAAELRRDAGCAVASLGFAMIDVAAKYWSLSKWNDRPKNKTVVKAIVKNFHDDGVHYKRASNAIPIIVRRTDIDLETLVSQKDVPLGLKTVGWLIVPHDVQIANGQHRLDAHEVFSGELEKDLADAEKQVAALERSPTSPDQEEQLSIAKSYRDQKKEYLGSLGQWIGQFYDAGERMDFCFYEPNRS